MLATQPSYVASEWIAAMRPLTVDLLVATGMPFAEAQALLPRV